ncbi:MAG: haloacid dehalogenase type II [Natrialbaceae archaeon]
MPLDTEAIETITVDSYGTLVDPSAATDALEGRVENPVDVSDLWRSRSLTYAMVGNAIDRYQDFYQMNRDGLAYALAAHGYDLPEGTVSEILSVYHELDPFEDVRPGLTRLRDAGYPVYVVSNGSPEMLESMVDSAGIDEVIEDTISADEVERFKPEPEIYRHAAARTGTPIDRIAHVAGPSFDVQGAKSAGMQAIWLNRLDDPWETFGPEPDHVAETFEDVADLLE